MRFGSAGHDVLQGIFKDLGILVEAEDLKEIDYKGIKFFYRIDGSLLIDSDEYIVEIKTVYANGFRMVEQEPKADHVIQIASYMAFEEKKRGILLYAGRDNGRLLQYNLESNGDFLINGKPANEFRAIWSEKVNALSGLKKDIEDKNLPGRDYKLYAKKVNGKINFEYQKDGEKFKTDWQCSYCAYRSKCWNLEKFINNEKEVFFDGSNA